MREKCEEFLKTMLEFLPSTGKEYRKSIEDNGEVLETVIIEDVFMPEIVKLISEERNIRLLVCIFDYFEEVSNSKDTYLINIFSITALEILGNDRTLLGVAKKYMGPKTMKLQIEADKVLGRI
ncbi:MAG TPA: resolvase [Lachnoclostridium phytofermentans]|uniref:Resolvase n=1 Tax=Lachnoclostridium phytofermentans TaxID=66219 RepID=A0A3D2XAI6_9FIRM|nr:resolvase [Lachnoclostridium sp.]HCL04142.1 resolvase [Lachnoclostridium phytofermentans]